MKLRPHLLFWGSLLLLSLIDGSPHAHLEEELKENPNNFQAWKRNGLLHLSHGRSETALKYLTHAIELSNKRDKESVWNYVIALDAAGRRGEALAFIDDYYFSVSDDVDTTLLSGRMNLLSGHLDSARERFQHALSSYPALGEVVYFQILKYYEEAMFYLESKPYVTSAVQKFPDSSRIVFQAAVLLFKMSHAEEAIHMFERAEALSDNDTNIDAFLMIAASYQSIGNAVVAKKMYSEVLEKRLLDLHDSSSVSYLSNYGLLLLNSKVEEEIELGRQLTEQALAIDPHFESALINMAMHYRLRDECDKAVNYLYLAANVSTNKRQLEIDAATCVLEEVVVDWDRLLQQRRDMISKLKAINSKGRPPTKNFHEFSLLYIPFYMQYHSFNDRQVQELRYSVYENSIKNFPFVSRRVRPGPLQSRDTSMGHGGQIKIGFISKLFGVFEPHSLLLDGIVKYLPRSHFRVFVLRILLDGVRSDHMISPTLEDHADQLVDIPNEYKLAIDAIERLGLDVLVFADSLCEPINHFLVFCRLAPLQIMFWGNPVTSGSSQIDYFISSEYMEHPYRTRMSPLGQDPYTEQLVMLPGQGIWYMSPSSSEFQKNWDVIENKTAKVKQFRREEFGLHPDWFIFLCPQNLFKLHVLFDGVVSSILKKSSIIHVVFTVPSGRPTLVEKFKARVQSRLGDLMLRCHFLPRVSSEQFVNFLKIGDALLHPFPFDGSRISADSITAGIPYVTLPSEYLKGRMGASYYRTMNMPEMVARNVTDYVEIAFRLSTDKDFYNSVRQKLISRSWLIFDDMEVPYSWTDFVLRAYGGESMSWETFLQSSAPDRDPDEENRRLIIRQRNQANFDVAYGREYWLLNSTGHTVLESDVVGSTPPRVFNDWKISGENCTNDCIAFQDRETDIQKDLPSKFSLEYVQECALSGDFVVAHEVGLRLVRENPDHIGLNFQMGVINLYLDNFDSALSFCTNAAELLLSKGYEDAQLFGCIGVAAFRVSEEEISVFAITRAWQLLNTPRHVVSAPPLFSNGYVEYTLISILSKFHRFVVLNWSLSSSCNAINFSFQECSEILSDMMNIPDTLKGGAYLLYFAMVKWTDKAKLSVVSSLSEELIRRGELPLKNKEAFLSEIHRLQESYLHILEPALACIPPGTLARSAHFHLLKALDAGAKTSLPVTHPFTWASKLSLSMVLVTHLKSCVSKELNGILLALARNLQNPYISDVVLLIPEGVNIDISFLPNLHKIRMIKCPDVPFYQHFLNAVRDMFTTDQSLIIGKRCVELKLSWCNCFDAADPSIYFDETLSRLATSNRRQDKSSFVLSSWVEDETVPNNIQFTRLSNHDSFVLHSAVDDCVYRNSSFPFLRSESANQFLVLLKSCGWTVSNPSLFARAVNAKSTIEQESLLLAADRVHVLLSDTLK